MRVVRFDSASAEPMVSQLTMMTPQETVVVSSEFGLRREGCRTVEGADSETHPAKLAAVHDVELRHVRHSREHHERAAY